MATYNFLDKTGLGLVWQKIKALIVQSDWEEDDSTSPAYIQNKPTIPNISLNGTSTTTPSFYAPTGAGTSGQVLKSNGSGAPVWAAESSAVFWVHFEDDYESGVQNKLTADKTFAELTAAYNSGKDVQATYYGTIYQMAATLDNGRENQASFIYVQSDYDGDYGRGCVSIHTNSIYWIHNESSDTISWTGYQNFAPDIEYPPYPTGYTNGQILQYNSTSGKWAANSIPAQNGALSISSNVITFTNASGTTSSITLPIYNGGV